MAAPTIRQRLGWTISPERYQQVRRLWIDHSKAEDRRDLPGLIATLAEDCVYEIMPAGRHWEGHDGARAFYTELLTAFPDIHFDLFDLVLGPQGVFEAANVTATHRGTWDGIEPTGKPVAFQVVIYFPWDPTAGKFGGEKVWYDRQVLSVRA